MSRTRYTTTVRMTKRRQLHRQEKELAIIARELQRMGAERRQRRPITGSSSAVASAWRTTDGTSPHP
jgi:hypothetical protein